MSQFIIIIFLSLPQFHKDSIVTQRSKTVSPSSSKMAEVKVDQSEELVEVSVDQSEEMYNEKKRKFIRNSSTNTPVPAPVPQVAT
jgi:hypothetical protein